jgi:hypothetical protein
LGEAKAGRRGQVHRVDSSWRDAPFCLPRDARSMRRLRHCSTPTRVRVPGRYWRPWCGADLTTGPRASGSASCSGTRVHSERPGVQHVAGVDEAGMSSLAGPVAAAAVIFAPGSRRPGADDSKKLDAASRQRLSVEIKAAAIASVAFADVGEDRQHQHLLGKPPCDASCDRRPRAPGGACPCGWSGASRGWSCRNSPSSRAMPRA